MSFPALVGLETDLVELFQLVQECKLFRVVFPGRLRACIGADRTQFGVRADAAQAFGVRKD